MGIDTHAIIENRRAPRELCAIADELNSDVRLTALMHDYDTVLRKHCPTLHPGIHIQSWALTSFRLPDEIDSQLVQSGWDAGYLVECSGPFGSISVYENLAEVSWYMCRWYAFTREPEFQIPLLEATRIASTTLNGDVATTGVFVPDSGCEESLALEELHCTMPELLAWLRKKFGPPAETLESIVQEQGDLSYSFKGYYVTQWEAGRDAD